MSFLFGKRKTPALLLRENKRMLDRSIREIEREAQGLQAQEKKLITEIEKTAKEGQMGAVKVMAKDLIRTRHQITKFYQLKSQLQGVSLRVLTLKSTQATGDAMKGVIEAMAQMNKIMQEFERQNEKMEMLSEVMGEEEEETEELVNQVLDEIGIDINQEDPVLKDKKNVVPGAAKDDHLPEHRYTSEIEIEIDEIKLKLEQKMCEASFMEKNLKDLKVLLQRQVELRREAHNKLLDEQGNIRVLCRCRPLIPPAVGSEALTCDKEDKDTLIYSGEPFQFDHVFGENAGQDEVFEKISPYITHVLDGRNLCLLAYGQTGSGKTYTMQGANGDGLYHKTCSKLFEDMQTEETSYEVTASVMEICDKKVFDLITKERTSVRILKDRHGKNNLVGLMETPVHDCKDVLDVINKGTKKRRTESTLANATSSRSHCLVLLKVTQANKLSKATITSNLWLIDLAGSEKLPEDKKQHKDSTDINQSLLYLANVMSAKANKEYTTYRNCVFTRILEDSLGDEGSKIVMIVHISRAECNIVESVKTLKFGIKAGNVQISYASPMLRLNTPSKMISVASRSMCAKDGAQSSRHGNKSTVGTGKEALGQSLIKRRNKTKATPAKGCGVAPLESIGLAKAASISPSHLINDMDVTLDTMEDYIDGKIPHFELPPGESESLTSKVAHEAEPNMSAVSYSDSELESILIRWVNTEEPHERIKEFDIYSCTPQEWTNAYYLVKLKKAQNGNYNRKFVGGYWKRSHRKKSEELQATMKYKYRICTKEQETGYTMFEYSLVDGPKDRVLCHIINEASTLKEAQKDIQKVHLGENDMRSYKDKLSRLTGQLLQSEEVCTKHKEEKQRLESRIAEEKQATEKYTQQLLDFRAFKTNHLSTRKRRKINNLPTAQKKCKKQDDRHVRFDL